MPIKDYGVLKGKAFLRLRATAEVNISRYSSTGEENRIVLPLIQNQVKRRARYFIMQTKIFIMK
jgi:hypothetical protein